MYKLIATQIEDENSSDLMIIKDLLDESYFKYNRKSFIENDPISIPHRYTKKEDIEIAAFIIATAQKTRSPSTQRPTTR